MKNLPGSVWSKLARKQHDMLKLLRKIDLVEALDYTIYVLGTLAMCAMGRVLLAMLDIWPS